MYMRNKSNIKRLQAAKAKALLRKVEGMTEKQKDMVVTAIMSMPFAVADATLEAMEKDPGSIVKDIRIPVARHPDIGGKE